MDPFPVFYAERPYGFEKCSKVAEVEADMTRMELKGPRSHGSVIPQEISNAVIVGLGRIDPVDDPLVTVVESFKTHFRDDIG